MSQENVEIVRAAWRAYRDHDNDAALALYDPEVDIELRYDAAVYHGIEGVRTYLGDLHVAFGEVTSEVEEWSTKAEALQAAGLEDRVPAQGTELVAVMREVYLRFGEGDVRASEHLLDPLRRPIPD